MGGRGCHERKRSKDDVEEHGLRATPASAVSACTRRSRGQVPRGHARIGHSCVLPHGFGLSASRQLKKFSARIRRRVHHAGPYGTVSYQIAGY